MRDTLRAKKSTRRVTKRGAKHGGTIESVERVIRETPTENQINIINRNSKFVVATYWWGRDNMNRNLQYPCPEDIMNIAKNRAMAFFLPTNRFPALLKQNFDKINAIRNRPDTPYEASIRPAVKVELAAWKNKVLSTDQGKAKLKEFYDQVQAEEQAKPGSRPVRKFAEMIDEWKAKCTAANVNFVSLNTEFERSDYQNGINGKPLFIKKILDAVAPRGVLYIDGDMWIHKYPHIFDIDSVDFMARGWNVDPRAKEKALASPYYDPYTFETSGGTMYFGNTQRARDLLDKWSAASSTPEAVGKADDRILSQLFTTRSLVVETNFIQLPVEYLWLTDLYKGYLRDATSPSSIEDALIEHPYCLTGEERAADQGAAASREPAKYEEEVIDNINYKRAPEPFYEYIFFEGKQEMRDGFSRYLGYLKTAVNGWTGQPLVTLVDFASKYGEFTPIALRNLQGLRTLPGTIARRRGGADEPAPRFKTSLPQNAPIRDILKAILEGNDVEVGGPVEGVTPEDEFVATDASTPQAGRDGYTRAIRINTEMPMFISGKNSTIRHLLAMCETLADINKHVGSYMFLSRIRWNTRKPAAAAEAPAASAAACTIPPIGPPLTAGIDFKRVVHQIWFGGEMPEWRKRMFAYNKAVCESQGFKHNVWMNADRNEENFPQTLHYQNAAIEAGQEIGQSRWAQVADLARLEIVYNNSGIYVDSLVEISPALLAGVVKAINGGATFVGCNEDACTPPLDCKNNDGEKYLSNSFFAATRANDIFKRLLSPEFLRNIDMANAEINHTTGPYFLRSGIIGRDRVFLFDSAQIFQFNQQETPYKEPTPDRFLFNREVPGSIKVNDTMYYLPGGLGVLQQEFLVEKKGPLATYHSGLGGTWTL